MIDDLFENELHKMNMQQNFITSQCERLKKSQAMSIEIGYKCKI